MSTYEVVLDNSRMLANCFEEGPSCTPYVFGPTGSFNNMSDFNHPTVVGSNVLADSSDSTYATWPEGGGTTTVALTIPPMAVDSGLQLHLRMRVFSTDPSGFGGRGEIFISTDSAGFDEIAGFSDGTGSGYAFHLPDGIAFGIREVVVPLSLSAWGTTMDELNTALMAGAYLDFNAFVWEDGGGSSPTFRVYEAWLEKICGAAPVVIDLPGWHVNVGGPEDWDYTATMDTSTEVELNSPSGDRLGVSYFAVSDQGAPVGGTNIYVPAVSGCEVVRATYVVIAYREADDGVADTGYGAYGYVNPPSNVPFLYAESPGISDGSPYSSYVFDDLPVGSYAGEIEWEDNEVLSRVTGIGSTGNKPAQRLWVDDFRPGLGFGTTPVHVAYFAMRLYYEPIA